MKIVAGKGRMMANNHHNFPLRPRAHHKDKKFIFFGKNLSSISLQKNDLFKPEDG